MLGRIYKLVNASNSFIYIGSTERSLEERFEKHRINYLKWLSRKCLRRYCSSFEMFRFSNPRIELVEENIFTDVLDLHKREGYHQLSNVCVNINIAGGRTSGDILISSSDLYDCPCGVSIKNTYQVKYKHVKSSSHRTSLRELLLGLSSGLVLDLRYI